MEQNFVLVYQTSFKHDLLELQKLCTDTITKEPEKIFESTDFTSITEKSLVSIIQNNNIQISEVKKWEYVLKWGLSQNPGLPSDPVSFSKEDFEALKRTLQQCISFIRFYELTSKELLDKVIPYENILPIELYKDLFKTFLIISDPNSKPSDKLKQQVTRSSSLNTIDSPHKIGKLTIDSKIITNQHAELISKWIERLEITDKVQTSYKFELLFLGSRDGLSREKFHEICDGKPFTITIVKVKDSDEILGGYNPTAWKSNFTYSITKDSFIFSFKNNDKIENHVLSRVINKEKAV